MNRHQAGFSTILIVLMTAVVLIGVLTTNVTLTLNQRQNTSNERASYSAVLASESGQETFRSRSGATPFAGGTPACSGQATSCYQDAYVTSLNTYLSGLGAIPVPGGQATLSVASASSINVSPTGDLMSFDLLATSTIGQDKSRIVRSYTAQRFSLPFPHLPGAVTSFPGVSISGNSTVGGRSLSDPLNTGLISKYMNVQTAASTPLTTGGAVTVTVPSSDLTRLGQLQAGHYVRLPTTLAGGAAGPDATFKVTGVSGSQLSLQATQVPAAGSSLASGSLPLTNVLNGISSTLGTQQLNVNAVETFYPGDQISVTIAGVPHTTTVTSVNGSTINTASWPAGTPAIFPEGTSIVKSTNAVVTAGSFSGGKQPSAAQAGPVLSGVAGSALLSAPTNDALFQQIMGTTPAALKAGSTVLDTGSFNGEVSGLTWLNTPGSANLNSQKLHGSGVLVVDGDLTINNNGGTCAFSGILFVRGNLSMHGNIEICGGIVVEGAILSSNGVNAIGLEGGSTDFGGTGQKVQYDPTAILDAIGSSGPYTFGAATSWRQQ
jgi:hypothetical protein